jgi:hypothetical protein
MNFKERVLKMNGGMTQFLKVSLTVTIRDKWFVALSKYILFCASILSSRFSSVSCVSTGHRSEYSDEIEMYWVEFINIFDQRREKGNRSPTQMYNLLSDEIGLNPATLASFYRHKTTPRKTSMDKIIAWIEKEAKRVVNFASNSSILMTKLAIVSNGVAGRNCHYCIADV